ARRGEQFAYRTPGLGFIPGEAPGQPEAPGGLVARRVGRDWRAGFVESAVFDNALGDLDSDYVDSLWRFATVLFDGETPAAVAGAYDDGDGFLEIGVDVARAYRGQGLGEAVVKAQAWAIHQEGFVPTYYCAPTNIRSHRTALTCGFVPVSSHAGVSRVMPALA
ncbi:MAG TPA: GNAT family N-acetyltransferase, partial [Tepidiformaceae bacterium]|nr:GNAT family N-acetyltransferase [Tepidiformaceae bacterium]